MSRTKEIPKLILMLFLMVLMFALTSCRFFDKVDSLFGFNSMLNYLNLNEVNIYYIQNVDGIATYKTLANFDFKANDKSYYKKIATDDGSNEFESQFSKDGILFTDSIYETRYLEPNDEFESYEGIFYIDVSVKDIKSSGVKLVASGYENMIVTYSDNSMDMFYRTSEEDLWQLDDDKKVKNIKIKCNFYNESSLIAPRIEQIK